MTSYPNQFLYLSDDCGSPTEIVNGARLSANMNNSSLCGSDLFDNIITNGGCDALLYQPGLPSALTDPVFWIDALDGGTSAQTAVNRGTGGPALNATAGSSPATTTNDPLWLGGSEYYAWFPGVASNQASTPDTAALKVVGDIEIIARVALDDWTPSTEMSLVSKYTAGNSGYELNISTSGAPKVNFRVGAANVSATASAVPAFTDGSTYWVRATRISSTGVVNFYWAADGDDVPTTWTEIGAFQSTTAGAIVSGTVVLTLANNTAGQFMKGKHFRGVVRNAINVVPPVNTADINFSTNTDLSIAGQTTFVTNGYTVTFSRSGSGLRTVMYQGRPTWVMSGSTFWEVADNDLLDFAATEDFTVMYVARGGTGLSSGAVVAKGNAASIGWVAINAAATGSIQTWNSAGAGTATATGPSRTAQQIHTYANTRRGSTSPRQITSYLDGVAGTPVTDPTGSLANSGVMRIGTYTDGTAGAATELLAVLIWRRVLTASELSEAARFFDSAQTVVGSCWSAADMSLTGSPWYDARVAGATEALGFFIEEWTGLDGAHNRRSSAPSGMRQGGAYFGPATADARICKFNVLLHGTSERGLNYLFNWLQDRLLNCCSSDCGTRRMWAREVCPTSVTNLDEGFTRFERVNLIDGPTWEAPPVPYAGCYIRRVSFTLGVGDPCLYSEIYSVGATQTMTTAGVSSVASLVLSTTGSWAGSNRQLKVDLPTPTVGVNAPIVTIVVPPGGAGSVQYGVPMLRIAGYDDPFNTDDMNQAILLGELIIEAPRSAGYTIIADLAARTVSYVDTYGFGTTVANAGFIGSAVRTGIKRWWSTQGCNNAFVIVEPVYDSLQTYRSNTSSYALAVPSWTVSVAWAQRRGCC